MAAGVQGDDEIIAGINVTPLVDIVLVILIIFIVTASFVLRQHIPVDLPKAATGETTGGGLLNVAITAEGQIYINGQPSELAAFEAAVREARAELKTEGGDVSLFISADVKAQYGVFARVVDRFRELGVTDIALDTQPLDVNPAQQGG
ncbi:MAG: biopolymer transporter ExbD [Deltaproteobacteria bacterium]|nr:biopolymer transporter ExbD [Deltaproteobacteria bacterium]